MKISKIFHWLYAFLMILPLLAVIFNFVRFGLSSSVALTTFNDINDTIALPLYHETSSSVYGVFSFLVYDVFGFEGAVVGTFVSLMTYWCCTSLIWLQEI